MLEKIKKMLAHNQVLVIAMVIAIVAGIFMFGCESEVTNPFNPNGPKVTRAELQIELDTYLAKVDLAILELDKQDAIRAKLAEIGVVLAQGGTVNPVGAGISLLGILGIGAVADNRRKDGIIKTLKNTVTEPTLGNS